MSENTRTELANMIRKVGSAYGTDPSLLLGIAEAETGLRPNVVNAEGKSEGLFQIQRNTWNRIRGGMQYSTDPLEQTKSAALLLNQIQKELQTQDPYLTYFAYARGVGAAKHAQNLIRNGMPFQQAAAEATRRFIQSGQIRKNRTGPISKYSDDEFENFQVSSVIGGLNRLAKSMGRRDRFEVLASSDRETRSSGQPESSAQMFFSGFGQCDSAISKVDRQVVEKLAAAFHSACS